MLISITIPVYNNPKGLIKSLDSLLKQSYTKWEAIVVDDGSESSLEELIEKFNDSRIKFHRFSNNKGRPAARQKSFEMLEGEYCGFLDAGDLYEENFLKNAMHLLKFNELFAVSQSMTIIFKDKKYYTYYEAEQFDISSDKFNNISFASTIFKSIVCKDYLFNNKLKYSQDKHFLSSISNKFKGEIRLLNSYGYIYDQGNIMSPKTTFKKYYYDFKRKMEEKKYSELPFAVFKIFFFYLIQVVFGYEIILAMRFKKNKL